MSFISHKNNTEAYGFYMNFGEQTLISIIVLIVLLLDTENNIFRYSLAMKDGFIMKI